MIIASNTWLALGLNERGMIFIDGIPVSPECVTECKIGEEGYIVAVDFVTRVDRQKEIVDERKIKGHVEIQVNESVTESLCSTFGLGVSFDEYQGQKKFFLVEAN